MYQFASPEKSPQILIFERNRDSFVIFVTLVESVHDPQIILMVLCIDEFENLLPDKLIVPIDQNLYRIIGAVVEGCINNIIGGESVNFILDIIDSSSWEF